MSLAAMKCSRGLNASLNFNIEKLDSKAMHPFKPYSDCAGYDLCSLRNCILLPNERIKVETGLLISFAKNTYGLIASKSGLAFNHGIDVCAGKNKMLIFNSFNQIIFSSQEYLTPGMKARFSFVCIIVGHLPLKLRRVMLWPNYLSCLYTM